MEEKVRVKRPHRLNMEDRKRIDFTGITDIKTLIELADTHENFEKVDIIERNNKILNGFYKF